MKAKDDSDSKKNARSEAEAQERPAAETDGQEIAMVDEPDAELTASSEVMPGPSVGQDRSTTDANPEFSVNIKRILDIQLPVTVSFGSTTRSLEEVLTMTPGTLIELETTADEPVMLKVNNRVFAWGKVVDVDGYYGVEVTEIVGQVDRIATLGGH